MTRDTIFALSSGALPAAIAIVRVSGPAAATALEAVAGRLPSARRASVATLRDAAGAPIDRAMILWLPGPQTVTGEDVAELHLHGGRAVAAAALAALDAVKGLRPAEAGEFTRRAFANGRLDLSEAEGLADLLAAETEGQRRQALRLAEGGLGRLVAAWRERLLALAAAVEAAIEFAEDEPDVPAEPGHAAPLATLIGDVRTALDHPPAERLRDGLRVVFAGPVNAGKSTLINRLTGREVAIATEHPGTTRDLIEVPLILDGVPLLLIDGAGLRDSEDPVERIGVQRMRETIASADLLLWLGNPGEAPDAPAILRVHARADAPGRDVSPPGSDLSVSALTGQGMEALWARIVQLARERLPGEDHLALHQRHRALLAEMVAELEALSSSGDLLLAAEHLRRARITLDRITGRAGVEDMLDALFGRFCVGK